MKGLGVDLRNDRSQKEDSKNGRTHQVAQMHRHRDSITPRLAERGGGDLDDPENQSDFWHFDQGFLC